MRRTTPKTLMLLPLLAALSTEGEERPRVEADGTVHVPAFDLPVSDLLSDESRTAGRYFREVYGPAFAFGRDCPNLFELDGDLEAIGAARQCVAEAYYETAIYQDTCEKHPVEITTETIAGVYTEVFVPRKGIDRRNRKRLLISIHGGGFVIGARYFSHTESMQVADMGGMKVISPDYRMAPEYTHPAGVDDIVSVYKEALKDYKPGNIGICGCSAGAILTAQTVAYLQLNELPLPGAIGLFCSAIPVMGNVPGAFLRGESSYVVAALNGNPRKTDAGTPPRPSPYYQGVEANDPVVAPTDETLRSFPPTLLISGTRDFALSGVLTSHTRLVRLGVEADLHVWEGMGHATFAFNPRAPESDEVYNVIVNFFDRHLGR